MTYRIVIVSGDAGGTIASNHPAEELGPEISDGDVGVTLASDDTRHVYKPVSLYVPFGVVEPDGGVRDLWNLVDERVDIVTNRARRIDTDEKYLYCQGDDEELDCDTLVLMTGTEFDPDAVPGPREDAHHFYSANGAEQFRGALAEFEGGRLMLSAVRTPHMCSIAPLEFMFIVDDWLRSRGSCEDTDFACIYPVERSHRKPKTAEWADPILAVQGVRVETNFVVDVVDPDERAVLAESDAEVDYDLLVNTPPHRGDELITDSGLDDVGWADVGRRAPHTTAAEGMYVIDDTVALPIPKAGSAAYFQAFAVAEHIAAEVRGCTPAECYDSKTVRFVEAGLDEASFVLFNCETPATMRQSPKPVHWAEHVYDEPYWLTIRGIL